MYVTNPPRTLLDENASVALESTDHEDAADEFGFGVRREVTPSSPKLNTQKKRKKKKRKKRKMKENKTKKKDHVLKLSSFQSQLALA